MCCDSSHTASLPESDAHTRKDPHGENAAAVIVVAALARSSWMRPAYACLRQIRGLRGCIPMLFSSNNTNVEAILEGEHTPLLLNAII